MADSRQTFCPYPSTILSPILLSMLCIDCIEYFVLQWACVWGAAVERGSGRRYGDAALLPPLRLLPSPSLWQEGMWYSLALAYGRKVWGTP